MDSKKIDELFENQPIRQISDKLKKYKEISKSYQKLFLLFFYRLSNKLCNNNDALSIAMAI